LQNSHTNQGVTEHRLPRIISGRCGIANAFILERAHLARYCSDAINCFRENSVITRSAQDARAPRGEDMANKSLFQSIVGKFIPATNARNEALAPAYAFTPAHALAQYTVTGCLNATFYASAEDQLSKVLELCQGVSADFIARTAIYGRERGL